MKERPSSELAERATLLAMVSAMPARLVPPLNMSFILSHMLGPAGSAGVVGETVVPGVVTGTFADPVLVCVGASPGA